MAGIFENAEYSIKLLPQNVIQFKKLHYVVIFSFVVGTCLFSLGSQFWDTCIKMRTFFVLFFLLLASIVPVSYL
jgi:hypothetical protein